MDWIGSEFSGTFAEWIEFGRTTVIPFYTAYHFDIRINVHFVCLVIILQHN